MPALAKMFIRIREAQCSRRLNLKEDELQEILQQIDYIPDLEIAQKSMAQNNELDALFASLQKSSGSIWKLGLLHVVVTLCIPASQYIPLGYDLVVMITTIILAVITFLVAVCLFCLYEKQMNNFLDLLKHNR
jgi:Flp pilus assembly protein TadB